MLTKAHFKYLLLQIYNKKVQDMPLKDERIRHLFFDLLRVTALKDLIADSGLLFACGHFAPEAHSLMREALDVVVKRLRP
jgi:hypothetical protein